MILSRLSFSCVVCNGRCVFARDKTHALTCTLLANPYEMQTTYIVVICMKWKQYYRINIMLAEKLRK